MHAVEERQKKMPHCMVRVIKLYLYKNSRVLDFDTGHKFIVNMKSQDMYVLLRFISKTFFHSFMQIL